MFSCEINSSCWLIISHCCILFHHLICCYIDVELFLIWGYCKYCYKKFLYIYLFCGYMDLNHLGINLAMEFLRNRQHACLALLDTKKTVFKEFAPFYTPTWNVWDFHFCFSLFMMSWYSSQNYSIWRKEPWKIFPPDPFVPFSPLSTILSDYIFAYWVPLLILLFIIFFITL